MRNTLFTCGVCEDIFRNRNDLNNHVRRDHQSVVKVKFQNGGVTDVKKGPDGMFKCMCEKRFKLPWSLQRHAKGCNGKLAESEEDEEERVLMDMDDCDTSESMNIDDRIVPADCFGALISYEKC
jgi:uncharacterized C2H2 Zn-finger protein